MLNFLVVFVHYKDFFFISKTLALRKNVFSYRPFHKTLPRYSAFVNWISVRFYEIDCMLKKKVSLFFAIEMINEYEKKYFLLF